MEAEKANTRREKNKIGKESPPDSMDITEKFKESEKKVENGKETLLDSRATITEISNESEKENNHINTNPNTGMSSERPSRVRSFVEDDRQEQASMLVQAKRTKTEYQLSAASPFVVYDRSGSSAMLSASPPAQLITYSPNPDHSSSRGGSPSPQRPLPVTFSSFPSPFRDVQNQIIFKPIARVGTALLSSGEMVQPVRGEPIPGSRIVPLTIPNTGTILKPVAFAPFHSIPGSSSELMPTSGRPAMYGINGPEQAGSLGILNASQDVSMVAVNAGFSSQLVQEFQPAEGYDDFNLDEELEAITGNIQSSMRLEDIQRYVPSGRSSLPRNRYKPSPRIVELDSGETLVIEEVLSEGCITSGNLLGVVGSQQNQNQQHSPLRVPHQSHQELPLGDGDPLFVSNNNKSANSEDQHNLNMTSPRPKSPRPGTPKKEDESFWDKLGTLGRKKRIKEVQEFEQEGKNAIDSPGSPSLFDIPPEDYDLAEGEERSLIERRSYADPKLQHLIGLLIDWINDELADQRIIVKSIEDDLYDGQILQKLLEKLTGQKLEIPEVSQSEEGQRYKLEVVLNTATHVMGLPRWNPQKWSVESIHSKSLVAILYLLVTLARHFRAPLRLPENVIVETVVVKKRGGKLDYRRVAEEITSTYDEFGMRCERDAFDALLDHAPDKLQVVKKSLITFVNKHLNKINLEVTDIETQFHDGVYLILLMGLLEGYFVPLFEFHVTPKDFEQKVFNVSFAFELMQDAGISKPKARPEDIVNLDLKSTLRVLYNLFSKYKHI